MNTDTGPLDSEELLHLGMAASEKNESEQAIEYLQRAIALSPADANIQYLLGAEHAHIGMYDRAISDMSTAVELDPALDTARFQLGLLYLTSKRLEEAVATWQPLDQLGAEHPLYLFKTGLISLANDQFSTCIKLLQQGIAANQMNSPLNVDMQKVIDRVQTQVASFSPAGEQEQDQRAGDNNAPSHLITSAYIKDKH